MTHERDAADALDQLPTRELHDRAVALARRRWDLGFLWQLLRTLPAAEAAAGHMDASKAGVTYLSGLISEVLATREGDDELLEALRPFYIDYLRRRGGGGTVTPNAPGSTATSPPA
ncbi:hypothetical protein RIF23_08370 [Lipingzhangella sp. LS1_29]|uniref:Uncharacterized protein n=1 Tax=Lipingzhangella rawalii TaxID=2055835 RepID=A0ABU2H4S2_9ACTN|nr:hypothetical protein [Lipingzhangella rawalii]MDS1270307.1 hypothetical protein [Lipingzhangella rawalii]